MNDTSSGRVLPEKYSITPKYGRAEEYGPVNVMRKAGSKMRSKLALVISLTVAFGSMPQALAEDETNLTDDIRFSRDLARHYYFDLAVNWLAAIEVAGDLNADNQIEVSLAKATIARWASGAAKTLEERKKYYDDAIVHYKAAIEAMGRTMSGRKAEAIVDGMASSLMSKGSFYTDLITTQRANDESKEVIAESREAAEDAFRTLVKSLNGIYGDLDEASEDDSYSEEEREEFGNLKMFALYRKGEGYYKWALLYELQDFNREDYLIKCSDTMEDYIWEATDENIWGLWAYYYQGMAAYQRGQVNSDQAVRHDEMALGQLTHIFSDYGIEVDQLGDLGEAEQSFVLSLVEKARLGCAQIYRDAAQRLEANSTISDTDDLTDMARSYQAVGDDPWMAKSPVYKPALVQAMRQGAISMVDLLEESITKNKLKVGPDGYRAYLEKANTLVDLGQTPPALIIVQGVAEANENSIVGIEAQKLLGRLLEQTDANAQPASVLRLAMDGQIAEENWLEALSVAHRLIEASSTDEDRQAYVSQAWKDIGGCYRSMGRNLEAAIAYESGFDDARNMGDDNAMADLALEAYQAWDRRFRETKNPFDQVERNRVREIVTSMGISGDIQFLVATESFSNATAERDPEKKKDLYATAVEELNKVAESSSYFERALVYKGRALDGSGDPDGALTAFESLIARVNDPNQPVGFNKKKAQQRMIASAECAFYRADVLRRQEKFAELLEALEGYEDSYEKQANFFPNVVFYRILAEVGLQRLEDAETRLSAMEASYGENTSLSHAYNAIASGYFNAYRQQEDPLGETSVAQLRNAATYLNRYNELTAYKSFPNLLNVADWYRKLGEFELAKKSYNQAIDMYGKQPKHQKEIKDRARPRLAEVLLELREFQNALPIWADIYAEKSRNRTVVRNYALCLGGWLEETENRGLYEYQEVPGAGDYMEAMKKWGDLKKGIEDAGDKLTDDWWAVVANFMFCQYMASKENPQYKESLKKLITNYRALHPDFDGGQYGRKIKRLERAVSR